MKKVGQPQNKVLKEDRLQQYSYQFTTLFFENLFMRTDPSMKRYKVSVSFKAKEQFRAYLMYLNTIFMRTGICQR